MNESYFQEKSILVEKAPESTPLASVWVSMNGQPFQRQDCAQDENYTEPCAFVCVEEIVNHFTKQMQWKNVYRYYYQVYPVK